MTTKTTTSSAELAKQADQRRAKIDAEQAELDRIEAEASERADAERAERDAATDEWWQQRRSGFHDRVSGRVDSAWLTFRDAVRDGGNALAAWLEYRRAVRQVAEDKLSIDAYFDARDRRRAEARVAHFRRVNAEAQLLGMVKVPRDISRADYDARLAAWRPDAEAYAGRKFSDDEYDTAVKRRHFVDLVPFPPKVRYPSSPSESGAAESARRGRTTSYAEAVDLVIADLEAEAVQAARAECSRDLEAFIAERTGR